MPVEDSKFNRLKIDKSVNFSNVQQKPVESPGACVATSTLYFFTDLLIDIFSLRINKFGR